MISTKEKMGEELSAFPSFPTRIELLNRISLAVECPPFRIEWERRNGFCWWDYEDGELSGCIGSATALVGYDLRRERRCLDREFRAELLGWEWSYLMHFEIAINALVRGDLKFYNHLAEEGLFPFVGLPLLPASGRDLKWVKYALK